MASELLHVWEALEGKLPGQVRLLVLGFKKKAEVVPSPVKLGQKGCWPYKRANQSCKRAEIGPCKRAEKGLAKGLLFLQH